MKHQIWLALALVGGLLTAACDQDPYRIHNYGDGGVPGLDAFPDGFIPPDRGLPDRRVDIEEIFKDGGDDGCVPQPEICNNVDDNCNDLIDEDFDKLSDPRYCENCNGCQWLYPHPYNAIPKCDNGQCAIAGCAAGYRNKDGLVANGCEYECTPTGPIEYCDGLDNDCDGNVDNLVASCTIDDDCIGYGSTSTCLGNNTCSLPEVCQTLGDCAGTQPTCQGKKGWVCDYPATVELLPCFVDEDCGTSGKIDCNGAVPGTCKDGGGPCFRDSDCNPVPDAGAPEAGVDGGTDVCENAVAGSCPGIVALDESLCDGHDGDCDDVVDDPWQLQFGWANYIGKECDPEVSCVTPADCGGEGSTCGSDNKCTPKFGECRDIGKFVCDPVSKATTICSMSAPGAKQGGDPQAEQCNGLDDDCDGSIDDEGEAFGASYEQWIDVGSFKIFAYEASRPESTPKDPGAGSTGRACSLPDRMPWADVTKAEAQAACERAGARLCTVDEWVQACQGESHNPGDCPAGPACNTFPYGPQVDATRCNGRSYDVAPVSVAAASGGSTTHLDDAAQSWGSLVGRTITFTSGPNVNVQRRIIDNTATRVVWATAVPSPITAGTTYEINNDYPLPTDEPSNCVSAWTAGDVFNMSGNVKEWVATDFTGGVPDGFEIKGGAYDTPNLDTFGAGLSCTYQLPDPGCDDDNDCDISSTGYACRNGFCSRPCDDQSDCNVGAVCTGSGQKYCVLPAAPLRLPTLGFRCCKDD